MDVLLIRKVQTETIRDIQNSVNLTCCWLNKRPSMFQRHQASDNALSDIE